MKEKDTCNQRLYKEVGLKANISPSQVEEMFTVICQFSAMVIQRGAMETIMLPNFGKFKIKEKQLQFLEQRKYELINSKRPERGTDKPTLDSSSTGAEGSVQN